MNDPSDAVSFPIRSRARVSYRIRTPRPERFALGTLGALIIVAPELFGGVFPWSTVVIAGMALATLLATIWAVRDRRPRSTPAIAIVICGAAVWTCIQVMPLPCTVVSRLAPEAARELRAVLSLAGAPSPSTCTLSRDPGATHIEVIKGVAIVASFLSAWWLSAQGARKRVIWLVALSALIMALVAHLHMALGLKEVFGVYEPIHAGGQLQLAPLMNPNNLGGFAGLGVPIWLDIVRRARDSRTRVVGVLAVVLCATTVLLSLSRGAIAVLFASAALLFMVEPRRARSDAEPDADTARRRWRGRLSVSAAISLGVGLGAYIAADRVLLEFKQGTADKLMLVGRTLRFAAQHPWLGVGRGAFASTYVAQGDQLFFAYAENFFTQWASDWGFPMAIALVFACVHALWRAFRDDESRRRLGAIVAVVGLAVQNLFDLGLELAGVAVVASTLLGAIVAPSKRPARGKRMPTRPRAATWTVATASLGAVAFAWLAPSVSAESRDRLEQTLRSQMASKDYAGFASSLQRAVRQHPVEPVFAVLAASESLSRGDWHASRWINRGMRLAPGWTAPHVQAFYWLWRSGHHDQALLEMRAVAEINPFAIDAYTCALVRSEGSAPILQAAPRRHRAEFLELAASCVGVDNPASAEIDHSLRREFPERPAARERDALRLARNGDLEGALAELDAVLRANPARDVTSTLKVEVLLQGKRYAEAAASALELARTLPLAKRAPLWRVRATALAALRDDAGWAESIAELRRIASDDGDQLADVYAFEGGLHLQRGQPGEALHSYRAAYRIKKESGYLQAYASISSRLGDYGSALWAYMELCQTHPEIPEYCAQRDALLDRARAMNLVGAPRN